MTWAIVNDGIVENLIVAEEEFAQSVGAKEFYEGCEIGKPYAPPHKTTEQEETQQMITDIQLDVIENAQAQTDQELRLLKLEEISSGGGGNIPCNP